MFKKTLTFIAAAALVLTMVGCSNTSSTDETGTAPAGTDNNTTQTTAPTAPSQSDSVSDKT